MSDTSTSTKKAGPVRSCPNYRIRMSSIDFDSLTICSSCRGKSCNLNDRCDVCVSWSDNKMNAYMKHQASRKRKRVAKRGLEKVGITIHFSARVRQGETIQSCPKLGSLLRSEIISDIDSRFNSLSTNKRPGSSVDLITGTFLKSPNNQTLSEFRQYYPKKGQKKTALFAKESRIQQLRLRKK